jgi:hypothetical protein
MKVSTWDGFAKANCHQDAMNAAIDHGYAQDKFGGRATMPIMSMAAPAPIIRISEKIVKRVKKEHLVESWIREYRERQKAGIVHG